MENKIVQLKDEHGNNIYPLSYVNLSLELLWTNSAPGTSFSAQTIELDLRDYELLYFVCRRINTNNDLHVNGIVKKGESGQIIGNYSGFAYREITSISDAGVTFGSGVAGNSANNAYGIPIYIYGIK